MAKQKSKKHHSKPHGGAVSLPKQLALQRAQRNQAALLQADLWARQDTQRALWLMVITVSEAFGIGPKRMQRDFFPALERNNQELRKMREENGETYAFEKLRQRAEQVSGIAIRHFYDPDPEKALREEEQDNE